MNTVLRRLLVIVILAATSLQAQEMVDENNFSKVEITPVYKDTVSIRALIASEEELFFAGSKGKFGHFKIEKDRVLNSGKQIPYVYKIIANEVIIHEGKQPEFRAVGSTKDAYFMLSVGNPALLYKYDKENLKLNQVYTEEAKGVFYNSMKFWNDKEGIAMGDPINDCLSVIITRDGGNNWKKVPCSKLPKSIKGEAGFAASNSNIAIVDDKTWIISGGEKTRVFFSEDKGTTWKAFKTPMVQGEETTGAYAMDFYDEKNGFVVGGDYRNPSSNSANKAVTKNAGKSWELVADGSGPGYLSGVKYVPHSNAEKLVAVGEGGVFYSEDAGKTWVKLSEESFHTIQFVNRNTAYAAGSGKIAKLDFK